MAGPGYAAEFLCRCRYFQAERLIVNTTQHIRAGMRTDSTSFAVLVCTQGCGTLLWPVSDERNDSGLQKKMNYLLVHQGDTVFLPAEGPEIMMHGCMQLLRVRC